MGPRQGAVPLGSGRTVIVLRLGRAEVPLPGELSARLETIGRRRPFLCATGFHAALAQGARDLVARSGARAGARVLVVVPDRTRELSLATYLGAVGEALAEVGLEAPGVGVAVASGTHAPTAEDTEEDRLGPWARRARLVLHRPEEARAYAGTTPAGTEVRVHPELLAADVVLAVGGTAFHWFAGFGGGPKLLFPGLGARASIAANHRRALAPWPPGGLAAGIGPGRLDGNPVAEDLAQAAELLPRATHFTDFGVLVPIAWQTREEFVAGTARFTWGRDVGEPRAHDVVVASAGGHPRDVDAIQAHKALFHAALYARDGAQVVLLADCPEGAGSAAFARWLAVPDRDLREEQARAAYDLNAQTAISLAAIAARCRVTWVGDGAPASLDGLGVVRRPARAAVAAVARALDEAGPGARAAILPVATDVVPYTAAR